jgi:endo-beta-N-acetylglucosaminidase D
MIVISFKACLLFSFVIFFVNRYDAITVNGDLDWQNKLNKYNKPFFDLCDGLFANYTWKVTLLLFLHL